MRGELVRAEVWVPRKDGTLVNFDDLSPDDQAKIKAKITKHIREAEATYFGIKREAQA